jgi:hypothetical protein
MGHFSVACGISNLSIHEDDKIGFMLLSESKSRFRDPRMSENVGISHYLYNTDLFAPFIAPLFGSYDGYGNIVDIKDCKTNEVLEEVFGIPALDVINSVTGSRSVYETDSQVFKSYYKGSRRFNSLNATPEEALTPLGFVKSEKLSDSTTEVFALGDYAISVRQAEPFNYWSIRSSTSNVVFVPEVQDNRAGRTLEEFAKLTKTFPGYPEKDWKKVETLNSLHGMYFLEDVYKEMNDYLNVPGNVFRYGKTPERLWDEFIAVMKAVEKEGENPQKFMELLDFPRFVMNATTFPEEHLNLLRKYEDSYEFLGVRSMMDIMTQTNRMFAPTYCGEQDGNVDAAYNLNKITNRILEERIAQWEDEDRDEDD